MKTIIILSALALVTLFWMFYCRRQKKRREIRFRAVMSLYDRWEHFNKTLLLVKRNGFYGLVNQFTLCEVVPPKCGEISKDKNTLIINDLKFHVIEIEGKKGVITEDGQWLMHCHFEFDKVHAITKHRGKIYITCEKVFVSEIGNNGLVCTKRRLSRAVICDDKLLIPFDYAVLAYICGDYITACEIGSGFDSAFDLEGKKVLNGEEWNCCQIYKFDDNYLQIKTFDDKYGLFKEEQFLLSPIYDKIERCGSLWVVNGDSIFNGEEWLYTACDSVFVKRTDKHIYITIVGKYETIFIEDDMELFRREGTYHLKEVYGDRMILQKSGEHYELTKFNGEEVYRSHYEFKKISDKPLLFSNSGEMLNSFMASGRVFNKNGKRRKV